MKLKLYHKIIPILTIPIFGIFVIYYGFEFLATISDRNGIWGNMHAYYDLSKTQFAIYKLIVTLILIGLIFSQLIFLLFKNIKKLNKTFVIMAVLIGFWIIAEIYMQSKFIGKG